MYRRIDLLARFPCFSLTTFYLVISLLLWIGVDYETKAILTNADYAKEQEVVFNGESGQ
jgi:hypothetical protein